MSVQDRINQYWTGRAPAYDDYQQRPERVELDRQIWSKVWAAALPAGSADILDVGTGSGQVANVIAGLGHRVTGIDLAEGMLDRAREHGGPAVFLRGDAVSPDFPPASFDAVVNRYVMWTLREPDVAVANWIRLLRPGGTIAVADSVWFGNGQDSSFYDERIHAALPLAKATSIEQTAAVLRDAGLRDVTVTPLTEVLELDRDHGVAPGHEVQMQYLITGRR
ncbi:class I SAM-dependent methyltransferase [Symbioplanes lichenis]|uniref:class I SAM-dependent methyltransferase n=1 Tax=Symbioplanes lichenis TaxID=1629072 RepID=UPI00273A015B|nr:class I SAM-dependent methyltransferase [Actinoplanes lichenis]